MDERFEISPELREALVTWAEEQLGSIGIFKDKATEFDKWREKVIGDLRSAYSDKAIDLFLRTKDNRKLESPDGFARITGPCGDTMEIYLKVSNGIITEASFQTDGCNPSVASGGIVAEMVKGKSIEEVKGITQEDVLNALGGLPEDNAHCALLAANTFNEALKNLNTSKENT